MAACETVSKKISGQLLSSFTVATASMRTTPASVMLAPVVSGLTSRSILLLPPCTRQSTGRSGYWALAPLKRFAWSDFLASMRNRETLDGFTISVMPSEGGVRLFELTKA